MSICLLRERLAHLLGSQEASLCSHLDHGVRIRRSITGRKRRHLVESIPNRTEGEPTWKCQLRSFSSGTHLLRQQCSNSSRQKPGISQESQAHRYQCAFPQTTRSTRTHSYGIHFYTRDAGRLLDQGPHSRSVPQVSRSDESHSHRLTGYGIPQISYHIPTGGGVCSPMFLCFLPHFSVKWFL